MAENLILPFAYADGANVMSQGDYQADNHRLVGNQPGIARSALVNKAAHQAATIVAGLGQFMADKQAVNVTDDKTPAEIAAMLEDALKTLLANVFNAGLFVATDRYCMKFPNEILLQFTTTSVITAANSTSLTNATYPIAFTESVYFIMGGKLSLDIPTCDCVVNKIGASLSQFQVGFRNNTNAQLTSRVAAIAIGK